MLTAKTAAIFPQIDKKCYFLMLPVRAFPGTKKAAVAAELAKSSAAQEPTEKPASARVSGQLLQMFNVSDRLM